MFVPWSKLPDRFGAMRDTSTLHRTGGGKIAYRHRPGKSPGVMFCPGYHSTMDGDKATWLDTVCAEAGHAYTRFDYQGHGESSGAFRDGTIGLWRDDALAVLDQVAQGPQMLVGSSMGAWTALLLTAARPERVRALVLIAPAPDFPYRLMWPSLDTATRTTLETEGIWMRPSEFEEDPYPVTMRFIEESRDHEVLGGKPVGFDGPVRILHGTRDEVIPTAHAHACLDAVTSNDVTLTLIKGGDHRLSTPADLDRLADTLRALLPPATPETAPQPCSSRANPTR